MSIFQIVFITNKITVSIPASYRYYFFLGACFAKSTLNSIGPFQDPLQGLKGSPQGAQWWVTLYFRKKEKLAKITTHCHSLPLDVSLVCLFVKDSSLRQLVSFRFCKIHFLKIVKRLVTVLRRMTLVICICILFHKIPSIKVY